MLNLRPAADSDRESIWQIFHEVVAGGDAFAFAPDTSRENALAYWFSEEKRVFVAEEDGEILGSYYVRPNQKGGGVHVANAGYMVISVARGRGIARAMAEHSLEEAQRLGFRAMQFNCVVSTNASAVHLWKQLGFDIVGTLPGAFLHPRQGYVDVYVMYRNL